MRSKHLWIDPLPKEEEEWASRWLHGFTKINQTICDRVKFCFAYFFRVPGNARSNTAFFNFTISAWILTTILSKYWYKKNRARTCWPTPVSPPEWPPPQSCCTRLRDDSQDQSDAERLALVSDFDSIWRSVVQFKPVANLILHEVLHVLSLVSVILEIWWPNDSSIT